MQKKEIINSSKEGQSMLIEIQLKLPIEDLIGWYYGLNFSKLNIIETQFI